MNVKKQKGDLWKTTIRSLDYTDFLYFQCLLYVCNRFIIYVTRDFRTFSGISKDSMGYHGGVYNVAVRSFPRILWRMNKGIITETIKIVA